MAAPQPIGTATEAFAQSSTVTAAAPSGVQAGDHQIVLVVLATSGETLAATPTGWLLLATSTMSAVSPADTTRAYLFASDPSADPGAAVFSQAKTSGTRLWSSIRWAYRGGAGPSGATFANDTTSATTHAVPQQTTTVADSVVVGGVILDQSGALNTFTTTVTEPSGWTELAEMSNLVTAGTNEALTLGVAAVQQATPGNVNGTFTAGTADDAMVWSLTLAGIPAPALVQQSAVEFSGAASLDLDATLPGAATAGNILWFWTAGDKNISPVTLPSGFTQVVGTFTGNVSLVAAYKVAAGGETTITATVTTGDNLSGSDVWVGEYSQTGSDPWAILGSSTDPDDGSTPTAKTTGTTGILAGSGLALAGWSIDSTNTEGTATYSNSYVERANPSSGAAGCAGLWLAELPISSAGGTTESTLTRGGGGITADQMSGAVVVFGRADATSSPNAGHASGTGAAGTVTVTTSGSGGSPAAGHASGAGAALAPTVSGASNVAAGHASGTGAAGTVTVLKGISTTAGHASGTGAALAPTLTKVTRASAGHASGTGAAFLADTSAIDPVGTLFLRAALGNASFLVVEAAFGADLAADPATWTWTDLTQDTQQADAPIAITVGRASEAAVSQPAQCEVRLDNRSGDYSIGGQSAHWPYIRRNTPVRVRVDPGTATYHVVFQGFADAWQPSWDITGNKAVVALSASGTLRRLQQNASPILSSLRRAILDRTDVVAYWPCEEGKNARSIASGLPGGSPMMVSGDAEQPFPKFATSDAFGCSAPLPEVALTSWRGVVPRYTATGEVQVRWLMAAPELMHGTEGTMISLYTTGTIPRWDVTYINANDGNFKLYAVDSAGVRTELTYSGAAINSTARQYQLSLRQSGANIAWSLEALAVGYTGGGFVSDVLAGETITAITAVTVAPNADIDDTVIGHVTVFDAVVSMYSELEQLNANAGELVTDRLTRLCAENATDITIVGTSDITMGAQGVEDLVTLLRQCETADQGLLYDGLGPGLTYITGSERINQPADLTLDVTAGHLVNELAPVDDDARNVNKVKAERLDGADATYEDTDGVLGTAAIGIYDDTIKANIELDDNIIDYATWLTNLGTVDGYRYPQLHVNFAKSPELVPDWLATTLSSRVDVEGIDQVREQHPGGTATLLLEGYDMEIDQFQWTATLNCSPYEPWRVGEYAEETGDTGEYVLRASSDGSTLAANDSVGATSLSVATPSGPLWTTTADDFPLHIDVGGIKITVTAISGTSSPQDFTVTSPTVTKALTTGMAVSLWQPPVLGL